MVQTQLIPTARDNGTLSPVKPFQDALGTIFPTAEHDARLQQARRIMADEVADVSDQDLGAQITELQYLIDSFIDDYERSVFDGKTLTQLMRG